jgi:hypothetical protein
MKQEKKAGKKPSKSSSPPTQPSAKRAHVKAKAAPTNLIASAKSTSVSEPRTPSAPKEKSSSEVSQSVQSTQKTSRSKSPEKSTPSAPPVIERKLLTEVPAILLEGDAISSTHPGGPGTRYALAAESVAPHHPSTASELPESYGTGQLFLSARDPHWIFASWDLSRQKQRELNTKSRDGHLVLRVFTKDDSDPILPDVHLHPESRTWFIHVPHPETRYRAELGYFDTQSNWQLVSKSRSTFTPSNAPSHEFTADFATIPANINFRELVASVESFISENQTLVEALLLANQSERGIAAPMRIERGEPWSPEEIAAITDLLTMDSQRRLWMGSIEITELIRRHLQEETASIAASKVSQAQQPLNAPSSISQITSPTGVQFADQRKFWFNINAELVIYGATEPNASVNVAGRTIKLRPDGTFSFRFALPDGRYDLPVVATSPDLVEFKKAELHFSRATEYTGHVEAHPIDPALRSPSVDNIQ